MPDSATSGVSVYETPVTSSTWNGRAVEGREGDVGIEGNPRLY
jgi:hypothetical protein